MQPNYQQHEPAKYNVFYPPGRVLYNPYSYPTAPMGRGNYPVLAQNAQAFVPPKSSAPQSPKLCTYFLRGICDRGDACRYSHDEIQQAQSYEVLKKDTQELGLLVTCPLYFAGRCLKLNCENSHPEKWCELTQHMSWKENNNKEISIVLTWKHAGRISCLLQQYVFEQLRRVFTSYWLKNYPGDEWTNSPEQLDLFLKEQKGQLDIKDKREIVSFMKGWSHWDIAMMIKVLLYSDLCGENRYEKALLYLLKMRTKFEGHKTEITSMHVSTREQYNQVRNEIIKNTCYITGNSEDHEDVQLWLLKYEILESIDITLIDNDFLSLYNRIVNQALASLRANHQYQASFKKVLIEDLFLKKLHQTLHSDIFYFFNLGGDLGDFKKRYQTMLDENINPFYASLLYPTRYQVLMFRPNDNNHSIIETIILSQLYCGQKPGKEMDRNYMVRKGIWLPMSPDGKNIGFGLLT